jgi:threonine/homoserine/homoserine lactone efflux protein
MYFKYTLVFSVTFLTSLLASIPFGPINLNVIYTTVQKNQKAGLTFAAAAAVIELLQSFIAIQIGPTYLVPFLDHYLTIIFSSIFLIFLGIFFLLKKGKKEVLRENEDHTGIFQFGKGMMIALFNIPTIAFWIVMTAYYKSIKLLEITGPDAQYLVICFISAAAMGKLMTLSGYALLSHRFFPHFGKFRKLLPKMIGILLVMMGLFQIFRIFIFDLAAQIN